MIGEFDLYGIFFPAVLVPMLVAFVLTGLLRWIFARAGLYRYVWHRSLFNFSLYLILLGAVVSLTKGWFS